MAIKKENLILREDFEGASDIAKKEKRLRKRLEKLNAEWNDQKKNSGLVVTENDIAAVVNS